MIIIGEKINGSIPVVADAIARRDAEFIKARAVAQAKAGATFIDCCASVPEDQVHVTFSMSGGLIEIAAPGVTKALGVSMLAERLKIEQKDVITFGDMPNDIEMLQWAGRGVAMGNARPEVKAVSDHITRTNDDAGVADVLEWWF